MTGRESMGRAGTAVRTAWQGLWMLPLLIVATQVSVAVLALWVDRQDTQLLGSLAYGGEPAAARVLLSTIAGSMMTVTALVFSITVVAIQLASSQYSPRVLGEFLEDRIAQSTLGAFIATFLVSVLVLERVRDDRAGAPFVPGTAIHVTLLFTVLSLGLFVAFIHRMTAMMRSANLVTRLSQRTARSIERQQDRIAGDDRGEHGTQLAPARGITAHRVEACAPGVVLEIDLTSLLKTASQHELNIVCEAGVGSFVPTGGLLARWWGPIADDATAPLNERIRDAVHLGKERQILNDPAYGVRQLVDIALRALSPGVNDPSTAVQALDQIHEILRLLIALELGPCTLAAPGNPSKACIHIPLLNWDGFVHLALDEICHAGGSDLQVHERIRSMADDLKSVAAPDRLAALDEITRQLK